MATFSKEDVTNALKPVCDPEINLSIVDLGLIYDIDITPENDVEVKMTLTTPACPYGEMLVTQARQAVAGLDGVRQARILLVWDPPWDPKEMCSDTAKDILGIW